MKISVCIITLNEEHNLSRCLRSVMSIADEIIILDSGSLDRTKEIAQSFGTQFFEQPWQGYVKQKNAAIALARHDWVFSIDADEELSEPLRESILHMKLSRQEPSHDAFAVSRIVYFLGKWIRFGDWYPDYVVRLFRKKKSRFAGGAVHERLETDGSVGRLKGELYHYTYKDYEDQCKRIEKYSTLWAGSAYQEGKRCSKWAPYVHAGWKFFRGFIIKRGWQGGKLGWQISKSTAREVFLKYSKLYAMQEAARSYDKS